LGFLYDYAIGFVLFVKTLLGINPKTPQKKITGSKDITNANNNNNNIDNLNKSQTTTNKTLEEESNKENRNENERKSKQRVQFEQKKEIESKIESPAKPNFKQEETKERENKIGHVDEDKTADGSEEIFEDRDDDFVLVQQQVTPTKRLDHPTRLRPKASRTHHTTPSKPSPNKEDIKITQEQLSPFKQQAQEERGEENAEEKAEEQVEEKAEERTPPRRPAGAVALPGMMMGGIKFDPSSVKLRKSPSTTPTKEETPAAPVDFRSMLKKTPTKESY